MKSIKLIIAAVLVMAGMSVMGQWSTNGDHIYNTNSGNIGIGTNSPSSTLDINNSTGVAGAYLRRPFDNTANQAIGYYRIENPTTGDLFNLVLRYRDGSNQMIQSVYDAVEDQWKEFIFFNFNDSKYEIRGGIRDTEYLNQGKVLFNNPGGVGIGTSNVPSEYKLAVDGKIICTELQVELSSSWPDYVFSEEYQLKPLNEVDNYIKVNGRLPGVKSAKEIEENGVSVGEMNKLLMEKVEELTLYVIQLQKEIDSLK